MFKANLWGQCLVNANLKRRYLALAVVTTCATWVACSTSTNADLSNRNPRGSTLKSETNDACGSQLLELRQNQGSAFDLKDTAETSRKGTEASNASDCRATSDDDAIKDSDQGTTQTSTKTNTSSSTKTATGTSTSTATDVKANPPPSPAMPKPGQKLFAANCLGARCHTTTGNDISGKTPAAITTAIQRRVPMRGVKVTADEIKLISEWLNAP